MALEILKEDKNEVDESESEEAIQVQAKKQTWSHDLQESAK